MHKFRLAMAVVALFSAQHVMALDAPVMDMKSKSCKAVADACIKGGFERGEAAEKPFWKGCMKPIMLGKTVEGVTIDAAVVKSCRSDKMAEMKKELSELKDVQ